MVIESCLLIADFAIEALAGFLADASPFRLAPIIAGFDQVVSTLLDGAAPCWHAHPAFAFVWTRPLAAVPSFAKLVANEPVSEETLGAEVDAFAACLRRAARRVDLLFVATWTWPPYDRLLGPLNHDVAVGPLYHLGRMNARLAEAVAGDARVRLLDASRWVALGGADGTSARLWHLGKFAFGPAVLRAAATDLGAAVQAARGRARKVIALDLDDTLWGGEVGEAGWEFINLGGHDPAGEAFRAFQSGLKALTRRGIALAIASKNTEAVALEAIDRHPEMILRRADFAAWEINWNDKAENVAKIARRLNVGLDAIVFIDNSPFERARVGTALPLVYVPEWPADVLSYPQALAELTCFDGVAITGEDAERGRMYAEERARQDARQTVASIDDYLRSLALLVRVERIAPSTLARAAQLLNKTNQMNLATRRMTEAAFAAWLDEGARHGFVFRVSDRHGDYGLTGLATLEAAGGRAEVVDFAVSCRAMGRGVERTIVAVLVDTAAGLGLTECRFRFAPTERNAPCRAFLDGESGLRRSGDDEYGWPVAEPYAAPDHVTVERADSRASTSPLAPASRVNGTPAAPALPPTADGTDLERRLGAVVSRVLGIPVGREDSFFALGVTSIAAAELVAGIRRDVGCDLKLIEVYDTPTIAGLARKCEAAAAPPASPASVPVPGRDGRIVSVQPHGSQRPFFFVHAAVEGDGFYCYDIARHLGPDQPFFALPPHGLDGRDVPMSVADMAADNVAAISAIQPDGPYRIGGFCKSALVALEMARQLRARGDDVDLLVVMASGVDNTSAIARALDAATTWTGRLLGWSTGTIAARYLRLKQRLEWLQETSPRSIARAVLQQSLGRTRTADATPVGCDTPDLKAPDLKVGPTVGSAEHRCSPDLQVGRLRHEAAPPAKRRRIEQQYARALAAYVPRPYRGRLECFVPAEERFDERWRRIANDVTVHVVPGGHNSCVIEHVDSLAGTLKACLSL